MIRPLKEFQECPQHKDESLKSYCEDCETLICIDCYHQGHKKHETIHVTEAMEKLRGELKSVEPEVTERQREVSGRMTQLKKERAVMEKRHQDELKALIEEEEEVKNLDSELRTLDGKIKRVNPESPMALLIELKVKSSSVLQGGSGGLSFTGQLSQLAEVVQKAEINAYDGALTGTIIIYAKQFGELKRFVQGTAPKAPNFLFLQDKKVTPNDAQTVKSIPRGIAAELASLLHVKHPPAVYDNAGPNRKQRVLISEDRWTHVSVGLCKDREGSNQYYFLPVSLSISEAIRQATGTTPRRVTPRGKNHEVMTQQTVEQWFSCLTKDNLNYWS